MSDAAPGLRIDKWLWRTRLLKSRSLAAKTATSGTMRVNGERIRRASRMLRPGDVLTFPLHHHIRVIRVLALGERRGPAPEAQLLYEDLAPKPEADPKPEAQPKSAPRPTGRPSKRGRREWSRINRPDS